jgi:hypothetical protein
VAVKGVVSQSTRPIVRPATYGLPEPKRPANCNGCRPCCHPESKLVPNEIPALALS